ncbi:DUF2470 domain-containing protein [Streptomyces triticagri]|uniref:DUF2470 domain-containing protein n=1 Tax=Streptomyces triticagri TaxID=2293568 RepID=A0A372M157_9ACTN|nr:DUF2470 domain-containing protein [Streptomyces triticagri]RFU84648.1 DUF2470 domain-containing protein [Streptomyces triticagri]
MGAAADLDPPAELTAPERVRSVLAQAVSLSLGTDSQDYDLIGMHTVGPEGRITLHPDPDTPLALQVAAAPRVGLGAVLEFTDISATPLRDRVRARVTLIGRLRAVAAAGELTFDVDLVTLSTAEGVQDVDPAELARTAPDPLAVEEAAMLTHLAEAHEDMVAGLFALGGSRLPHGVLRTLPLALDRHGITLRCEYREGHCDLRLPFPDTARDAVEAGEQVRRLLAVPICPHRRHSSTRP